MFRVITYTNDQQQDTRTFETFTQAYNYATTLDASMLGTENNYWHMLMRIPCSERLFRDKSIEVCTNPVTGKRVMLVLQ